MLIGGNSTRRHADIWKVLDRRARRERMDLRRAYLGLRCSLRVVLLASVSVKP